jgi:hypothetical protein
LLQLTQSAKSAIVLRMSRNEALGKISGLCLTVVTMLTELGLRLCPGSRPCSWHRLHAEALIGKPRSDPCESFAEAQNCFTGLSAERGSPAQNDHPARRVLIAARALGAARCSCRSAYSVENEPRRIGVAHALDSSLESIPLVDPPFRASQCTARNSVM